MLGGSVSAEEAVVLGGGGGRGVNCGAGWGGGNTRKTQNS